MGGISGCAEGYFLEHEDWKCCPYRHTQQQAYACEGVGGEQIETPAEFLLACAQYTHGCGSESAVSIHSGNHRQ